MPKNALLPANKNALRAQNDPLQDLLTDSSTHSAYRDLTDYLNARQMMPSIQYKSLPPNVTGEFTYSGWGDDIPASGRLALSYGATPQTIVHELTHAADRQIRTQYENLSEKNKTQKLTSAEQQFIDAYKKLVYDRGVLFGPRPEITRLRSVNSLAPQWSKEKSGYRATPGELAAFGMGSTVAPNTSYSAPLHVDPTYATEFSILLDMATRLQKTQPMTGKK